MTRKKAKELGRKIKKVTPTEFRVMKAQSEEGLPEFSLSPKLMMPEELSGPKNDLSQGLMSPKNSGSSSMSIELRMQYVCSDL